MAVSYQDYTGTSQSKDFTFPYIQQSDIKVRKTTAAGVVTELVEGPAVGATPPQYQWSNATRIYINDTPAATDVIRVYRDTASDSLVGTFYPGSAIRSSDLNDNFTQNLYVTQEAEDSVDESIADSSAAILATEAFVARNTGTLASPNWVTRGNGGGNDSGGVADPQSGVGKAVTDAANALANSVRVDGQTPPAAGDAAITIALAAKEQAEDAETAAASALQRDGSNTITGTTGLVFEGETNDGNETRLVVTDPDTDVVITLPKVTGNVVVTSDGTHKVNNAIMAENSVNSDQYVNLSIKNEHIDDGTITSGKLHADAVVVNSEHATATVNDTSFFTTSSSDARYFRQDNTETILSTASWTPDSDAHVATTKAIENRIVSLVDDVGGFTPIANETSFPDTNPDPSDDAGTIVSIQALSVDRTSDGSGVISISNGNVSNNQTVVIYGLADDTTYKAGYGMLVETTSSDHVYTFHRTVPKAAEVSTVASKSAEITRLGTVAAVEDMENLGTVACVEDMALLGTTDCVADMALLGTSDCVADMALLATTDTVQDLSDVADIDDKVTIVANKQEQVTTCHDHINDINNYADTYQIAASAPTARADTTALQQGDLWFDTTTKLLKVRNTTSNEWETAVASNNALIAKAFLSDKGDLITASADDTPVILGAGTNGEVLVAASGETPGLKWAKIDSDGIANGSIDHVHLAVDIIDGDNIQDNVIDSEHYKQDSIDAEHYAPGSVDTTALGADCVDGTKIGDGVIESEHYANGSIDLAHLAGQSVDESKLYVSNAPQNDMFLQAQSGDDGGLRWASAATTIADGSITTAKLDDDAVDADKLASNAVVNASVAAGAAIAFTKLEDLDSAKILVGNGSNDAAEVDMSGDATISNAGVVTIANDAVDGVKLADAISNTSLTINGAVVGLGPNMADSNTVLGKEAAELLESTGVRNVAIGEEALHGATGGGNNDDNIAIGYQAGKLKDDAERNISIGSYAGGMTYDSSSNDNIAIGYESIHESTYGGRNIAIGNYTLWDNTAGADNVVIGHEALKNAPYAGDNVAIGYNSMHLADSTNGSGTAVTDNVCVGRSSGYSMTENSHNTFIGAASGWAVDSATIAYASYNVGVGAYSMAYCTSAAGCVAIGYEALKGVNGSSTGDDNVAIGYQAMLDNLTGYDNTAVGTAAMAENTYGYLNTAIGNAALARNEQGDYNTAIGAYALFGTVDENQTGNTAIGGYSMYYVGDNGGYNVSVGYSTLYSLTTGDYNTAVGQGAGYYVTTGSNNTYLGRYAGCNFPNVPGGSGNNPPTNSHKTGSNSTYIGQWSRPTATDSSNEIVLGNDDITNLVCADTSFASHSDGRDKTDIVDLPIGLDFINTIRPVKFTWAKRDNPDSVRNGTTAAGFIAQDFQSSMTAFDADFLNLVYDDNPDKLMAKYSKLLPVLVQAVKELSTQVNQLKEELELCTRT